MSVPLVVTAHLLDGRVSDYDGYLPLDGVLAYAWMLREHPDALEVSANHVRPEDWIEADLPIEKRGTGEDWYYASSFAQFEKQAEYTRHANKRFDADLASEYADWGKRKAIANVAAGPLKMRRSPLPVIVTPRIWWYVVGDARAIEDLLVLVTHIGKHRAQGMGLVARWEVAPAPADYSETGPDGQTMRAIPDAEGERMTSIRPPYWRQDSKRLCRMP